MTFVFYHEGNGQAALKQTDRMSASVPRDPTTIWPIQMRVHRISLRYRLGDSQQEGSGRRFSARCCLWMNDNDSTGSRGSKLRVSNETPMALKNFRWQGLLARQILHILLRESNSFPKHGASENLGSGML